MLYRRRDSCSSPTGDTDRITLAKLRIGYRMRNSRGFDAELLADKQESVSQRFAINKIFRIKVDTELGVVVLRLGENEVGILIEQGIHSVELADYVYLILGRCACRNNHLQQDCITLGVKLRFFVLKHQFFRFAPREQHSQPNEEYQCFI